MARHLIERGAESLETEGAEHLQHLATADWTAKPLEGLKSTEEKPSRANKLVRYLDTAPQSCNAR
jgi:hypothetical protein